MKNILAVDVDTCTGCRNCELACSVIHTKTFNPARSRIQILKNEAQSILVPMVCLHCENPLCAEACPAGAIIENKHGILYVNSEDCIGCSNCVTACIYGGIEIDPVTTKAIKCDLCFGNPACAKACDYGAITYLTTDVSGFRKRAEGIKPLSVIYNHEEQEVEQ